MPELEDEVIEEITEEVVVEDDEPEIIIEGDPGDEDDAKPVTPTVTVTPEEALKIAKANYPDQFPELKINEEEDDWATQERKKTVGDALQAMQQLAAIQADVEAKAIAMLGDMKDDEAISFLRSRILSANPAELIAAQKDPSMLQGVIDQHIGQRARENRPLVPKNTSASPKPSVTGRATITLNAETKQEYDRFVNGVLPGLPPEQQKAAKANWLKNRGLSA